VSRKITKKNRAAEPPCRKPRFATPPERDQNINLQTSGKRQDIPWQHQCARLNRTRSNLERDRSFLEQILARRSQ
jgi:hypothetical protein